jgi:Short C-terminal domain
MFGRKRKREQDGLGLPTEDGSGLAGLGNAPSITAVPSRNPTPAAAVSAPEAAAPAPTSAMLDLKQLGTTMTTMGQGKVLAQILSGHGPVGEMVAQIRADPQGFRQRIMEQAQAAGASTFVMTPQGLTPIGHPAGAAPPTHVDVIDELTKAADLHDKGALTDEEFEKLKHKLLGQ